jgi:ribosomal protein L37E
MLSPPRGSGQPASLPFGRHKDTPLPEVPADYLRWLLGSVKLSTGLVAAVVEELVRRGIPREGLPAVVEKPHPPCRKCGPAGVRLVWQPLSNGRRHLRAECRKCGRLIYFAPQTQANIDQVKE